MRWQRTRRRAAVAAPLMAVALGLTACGEEETIVVEEKVRAIKSFTVVDRAGGASRRFTGALTAANTSNLSFAKSGTVASVAVSQGDRVTAGQVLAELDPEFLTLALSGAQSELAAAEADFADKRANFDRQRQLFERGWVAQAALDQATAAFDAADAQLELTRSRVASAERDLSEAVLVAPFDGVIASRTVEPFQEVQAGSPLFVLNAEDTLETAFDAPDAVVGRLAVGMTVDVEVAAVPECGCRARITEISTAASSANAVPVTATLFESPSGLLPGMTATIEAVLAGGDADYGYLVPITAIAPGDDAAPGYLFIFDPEAGVVRRTPVRGGGTIEDNLVEVAEGVAPGDIVASAGVSFLRDGQAVRLLAP